MKPEKRIYLSPPHLDGRERELLIEAYESNWIATLGPHIDLKSFGVASTLLTGHRKLDKGQGVRSSLFKRVNWPQ